MEVQIERHGNFLVEETAERASGGIGVTDQFLHVKAERHGMVAMTGARRPCWILARQEVRDIVEVTHPVDGQRFVEHDQPSFVTEQLPHRDRRLAVLILGNRRVIVQPAARIGDGQRQCGQAFRSRHKDDRRVLVPGGLDIGIASTAPKVDDLLAAPICGHRSADLAAFCEIARERGANALEAAGNVPRQC